MKYIFTLLTGLAVTSAFSQDGTKPVYDAELAKKLGADTHGMKMYMLVILKTGPTAVDDNAKKVELFNGHMANIERLASEGKLVVAGPFGKNDKGFRGIFILDVKTAEEAKALLETDPAIRAGLFATDILPWYGSAALPEYLPIHEKIEEKKP